VIGGLPGLGKSQLALEYCYRREIAYRGIFWLRAEETSLLQQDYAAILEAFDMHDAASGPPDNVEVAIDQVMKLLRSAGMYKMLHHIALNLMLNRWGLAPCF
jgi:hypothetical protein